jgi:hypothetical protein
MSLVLSDQDQVTLTAAALESDGKTADPNAKVAFTVDSAAVVAITDNGDGTALAVAGTDGVANVIATATDPDGNAVPSAAFAITVVSATSDTKTVSITAATPVAKTVPAPVVPPVA